MFSFFFEKQSPSKKIMIVMTLNGFSLRLNVSLKLSWQKKILLFDDHFRVFLFD